VNFGERGKSSGRHSLTSKVKPVLTVSLTKGRLRVCANLVKGSLGFIGEVFVVMTQVDLGLTIVSGFDSAESVISVNDVN
jgi:hypothetical protein